MTSQDTKEYEVQKTATIQHWWKCSLKLDYLSVYLYLYIYTYIYIYIYIYIYYDLTEVGLQCGYFTG